ncbi:MAG: diaminopimelate epimerase [Acidimicrobiia bacterium]|nr:diaminopimelate epimerase [Acidimicrobiia bacterium]
MHIGKYEGLGNDFAITSVREIQDSGHIFNVETVIDIAKKICNRNFGIGSDDLLILDDNNSKYEGFREFVGIKDSDCVMYLINADGSIPEMSGNGIRCFAQYANEQGYGTTDSENNITVKVATLAGLKIVIFNYMESNRCMGKVDMGPAIFEPHLIPLQSNNNVIKVNVLEKERISYVTNTGIPHWVIPLDSLDELNLDGLEQLGEALRFDERFPENTNVNFVYIVNPSKIYGRTIERGVGETLACGTGITAMVASLYKEGLVNAECEVIVSGGIGRARVSDDTTFLYGPMNKIADIDFVL